ncbi:hypothetical protein [Chitinibacter sp. S2-10]|uniref:hypothetical protein n=1 Tax=Chitinibacter sp. S2-10 TaxID=3373597 RepID=UPI003977C18E
MFANIQANQCCSRHDDLLARKENSPYSLRLQGLVLADHHIKPPEGGFFIGINSQDELDHAF